MIEEELPYNSFVKKALNRIIELMEGKQEVTKFDAKGIKTEVIEEVIETVIEAPVKARRMGRPKGSTNKK